MPPSYRFRVSGRVQGVGFRIATLRRAQALELSGWVRNRTDGGVDGMACGAAAALEALRSWLTRGPPGARVTRLDWEAAGDATPPAGFSIRD